jgi:adenylosuccinate synthase
LLGLVREHNVDNAWQGPVRYGWFDTVLARRGLAIVGGVDRLAVTHLDLLPKLERWTFCSGYRQGDLADNTQALLHATPLWSQCEPSQAQVLGELQRQLGVPVGFASTGPRSTDLIASTWS